MKTKNKKLPVKLSSAKMTVKTTGNFLKKGTNIFNKYYTNAYDLELAASYEY